MEGQDNEMTHGQENGAIDESGKVDRIRDILFGSQMRDYDGRFQKLEERLTREADELRERFAAPTRGARGLHERRSGIDDQPRQDRAVGTRTGLRAARA